MWFIVCACCSLDVPNRYCLMDFVSEISEVVCYLILFGTQSCGLIESVTQLC
jgi:hypothetical protein